MIHIRIFQVLYYGWKHAGDISTKYSRNRFFIFLDILLCYKQYHLWSNQYKKESFFCLSKQERESLGVKYKKKNLAHEEYVKSHFANRLFLYKWKDYRWELNAKNREKRLKAYTKQYNMGKGCIVSFDVHIERNHFLPGKIRIGRNVLFGKHVYIDYSGEVEIKDNVQLANGVVIESHHHPFHSNPTLPHDVIVPTKIIIEEDVIIGSRAVILSSCHYIGKNARVGAGAVVTKDVPAGSVVAGVPAKIIRFNN